MLPPPIRVTDSQAPAPLAREKPPEIRVANMQRSDSVSNLFRVPGGSGRGLENGLKWPLPGGKGGHNHTQSNPVFRGMARSAG